MEKLFNKNLKNILRFTGLFLLFLLFEAFYILILYLFKYDLTKFNLFHSVILSLVKESVFVLIFILIYHRYLKEKWIDFKKNWRNYLGISSKAWITGLLIMIFSNAIITKIASPIIENEASVQTLIANFPIAATLLTIILGPFVEEMLFRKCLQDACKRNWVFILLSGLLFGICHVMSSSNLLDYLYIIPYGSLGACFAYALTKTDNIYGTLFIHALHNAILTILALVV